MTLPGCFKTIALAALNLVRQQDNDRNKTKGQNLMISLNVRITGVLSAAAMLGLIIFTGYGMVYADRDNLSTAVFFVT